jgi:hypothetical protein
LVKVHTSKPSHLFFQKIKWGGLFLLIKYQHAEILPKIELYFHPKFIDQNPNICSHVKIKWRGLFLLINYQHAKMLPQIEIYFHYLT